MNIEDFRSYCISLGNVTESFPFDKNTLVFKIKGKIFTLTNVEKFHFFNVKCNPDKAVILREKHNGVNPGFHMNKKHWNSIATNEDINETILKNWIKDSFDLVVR
jgi:predicted DNA-binding protein (MmcQ/YjbR family)